MSSPLSPTDVDRERLQLQPLSNADPGVAYVGHRTGQLALRFDPPENGVHRVLLSAAVASGSDDELRYHAVVHRTTEDGERVRQRARFGHPFPAYDWLLETVPDFDLVETVYVNEPEEDDAESSTSSPTDK